MYVQAYIYICIMEERTGVLGLRESLMPINYFKYYVKTLFSPEYHKLNAGRCYEFPVPFPYQKSDAIRFAILYNTATIITLYRNAESTTQQTTRSSSNNKQNHNNNWVMNWSN